MKCILFALATLELVAAAGHGGSSETPVQLGSRPFYLINEMADSELKTDLEYCAAHTEKYAVSHWSIGHRGACMQFPEHTLESYSAALSQGAGIVECDVTFTKDKELVCRHAQCDLHTTTDVVTRADMNAKCTTPWAPGVAPKCCTSDFTLAEIETLCAKMDASVADAATAEDYVGGTAGWRTDLYSAECPKVPTHAESIALIDGADAYFTPELKTPDVEMPFDGFTQEMYAQKMVDEYVAAGVPAEKVWVQSFLWDDIIYWINNATEFGAQAVALEGTYDAYDFNTSSLDAHFKPIVDAGANFFAPPMWMLLDNVDGAYAASDYIKYAKDKGFKIITWTLERSGPLSSGGGWYFQSVNGEKDGDSSLILGDGQVFEFLHALNTEVGIEGIFSDWPATTTFYANCMGLALVDEPVTVTTNGKDVGSVQIGSRPYYLVDQMSDSTLKSELEACAKTTTEFEVSDFSIGHRGACMQFPEHTLESYSAALSQGAGIVECDVTFTKDKELVCRHAQCDLHTTTDVVTRADMNAKCTTPWAPGVAPKCCTSDFTLAEIETLCAKMDASVADAATAEEYVGGTAGWRTDLYSAECPKVPTHAESIALIDGADAYFTPELKTPDVEMPFDGFTQEMYAQKMVDEYVAAGVPAEKVWVQSFLWDDIIYWINNATEFGAQAVALEGTYDAYDFNTTSLDAHFKPIVDAGANFFAPPMWMLLDNVDGAYAASDYIKYAKDKGFKIITWTLERSGPLSSGGGWYFQSVNGEKDGDSSLILGDGQVFEFLDAMVKEVGIEGIFSDWPATTTFYANCMNLGMRGSTDGGDGDGGDGGSDTDGGDGGSGGTESGAYSHSFVFVVFSLMAVLLA